MKRALFAAMLAGMLSAGCSQTADGDGGNPVGPSGVSNPNSRTQPMGSIAFSTTAIRGWSSIDVYVDLSYHGTLRAYHASNNGASSCVAEADSRVVAVVPAGPHSYFAVTNNGLSWNGTQSIGAGACIEIYLTCAGGDCPTQ